MFSSIDYIEQLYPIFWERLPSGWPTDNNYDTEAAVGTSQSEDTALPTAAWLQYYQRDKKREERDFKREHLVWVFYQINYSFISMTVDWKAVFKGLSTVREIYISLYLST